MNIDLNTSVIERFSKLLMGRDLFTPKELVKRGIFGSKQTIHRAIKRGELEAAYSSARRLIIFKDSILKYLDKAQK